MGRSQKSRLPGPEPAAPASPGDAVTAPSAEPTLPPIPPEREAAIHERINALGLSQASVQAPAAPPSAQRASAGPRLPSSPALKALLLLGPVVVVGLGLYWASGGSLPSFRELAMGAGPTTEATSPPTTAGPAEGPTPAPETAGTRPEPAIVAEAPTAATERPVRPVSPAASPSPAGPERTAGPSPGEGAGAPPVAETWRAPGRPLPWVSGPQESHAVDSGARGGTRPVPWETSLGSEWAPGTPAGSPPEVPRPPAVPEVPPRAEPPVPPAVPQPAAPTAATPTPGPWTPSEYRPTAPAVPEASRVAPAPEPARAAEAPKPPAAPSAPRPTYQPVYPGYGAPYGWAPQPYYPYAAPGRSQ